MLIYLDARDMINVFNRGFPLSLRALAKRLEQHRLAVPYSLIVELVPHDQNSVVVQRRMVELEECFSLAFLRFRDFGSDQLRTAYAEFHSGSAKKYDPIVSSFVETFDEREEATFFSRLIRVEMERTLGLGRLYSVVDMLLSNNSLFRWSARDRQIAEHALDERRRDFECGMALSEAFQKDVTEGLRRTGDVPPDVAQFARWLRRHPRAAPGWQLFREVFEQLARDRKYRATVNDVFDLVHVLCVPHVDICTLDANKAETTRKACRRLREFDRSIDYDSRVFSDVSAALRAIPN